MYDSNKFALFWYVTLLNSLRAVVLHPTLHPIDNNTVSLDLVQALLISKVQLIIAVRNQVGGLLEYAGGAEI